MRKEIFALGIGSLLLIIAFSGCVEDIPPTESITIYVDDDGGKDYTNIQDAIDAANDGDTVFVYSGTYYENVNVSKPITLRGEDKNTTIIDGSAVDDVVYISANNVIISGFTIQNSGRKGWQNHWDGGIDIRSRNCIISENIFKNNLYGIVTKDDGRNNTF